MGSKFFQAPREAPVIAVEPAHEGRIAARNAVIDGSVLALFSVAAPAGKAYQLWFIKDGKKMPGNVFKTDPSGSGTLKDQMPAEALSAVVFAITLEPENGVPAPTGAIYLVSGS